MQIVTLYYKVIDNSDVTHLKAELLYDLGGYNMFTGKYECRGYYMSVRPVKRRDNGGCFTESFKLPSGKKQCILEVARQSTKKMDEAVDCFISNIGDFIVNHFSEFKVNLEDYEVR